MKRDLNYILLLIGLLLFSQQSYSQFGDLCEIQELSQSFNFQTSGGTITADIILSDDGLCSFYGSTFTKTWISGTPQSFTITIVSANKIRVVMPSNLFVARRVVRVTMNYTGGSYQFNVEQQGEPLPATPSTPGISSIACNGTAVLYRIGTPSSGVTWYWQGKNSLGTSTSKGSGSAFTANEGSGNYYIRARKNSNQKWSSSSAKIYVSMNVGVPTPSLTYVTVNNYCGNSSLEHNYLPGEQGITWYWQQNSTGTSTNSSSSSLILNKTSGSVIYLRAKNNAKNCWSSALTVSYTIKMIPGLPSVTVSNECGRSVLTRANPPSAVTWYWQNSSIGTSTSNNSKTITRNTGNSYFLRPRSSSGCWGIAKTVNYQYIVPVVFYEDTDNDGYGNASSSISACSKPVNYVSNNNDYDDTTSNITNIAPQYFYRDIDGDGFGDPNDSVYYSVKPSTYVIDNTDDCPSEYGINNGCEYLAPTLSNENYVFTRSYQKAMPSSLNITKNSDVTESVTYFDGLGRTKQQIGIKQSPNESDIISHIAYDDLGRQEKEWLPYVPTTAGAEGSYRTNNQEVAINSYYTTNFANDLGVTPNPYSQKTYENSPLNRILEQTAPGESWKIGNIVDTNGHSNGHSIKFNYETNINTEVRSYTVSLILVNDSYTPTLIDDGGYYNAAALYKTITKDENWTVGKNHTTEEFKNKQGQVVLKRTYADINSISTAHDTYYIYDDYGNLTYVLPPKVDLTNGVSVDELTNLAYQYQYDNQNRLVEKQIPGKAREYIVYDNLDRPVMTKDALNDWLFTKYDVLGRVVYTGIYQSTENRIQLQTRFDDKSGNAEANYEEKVSTGTGFTNTYYSNIDFPNTNLEVLTVNYYDDYEFNRAGTATAVSSFTIASTTNVNGLATGSKVKVLDTDTWITTVSYYDEKARNIYVYSKNDYLETVDIVEQNLDFVGKTIQSRTQHTKAGTTIVTLDNFTYDHVGRLLSQTQCIGDETLGYNCPTDGTTVADLPPLTGTITTTTNAKATKSIVLLPSFRAVATPTVSFTAKIISNAKQELIASNSYDELGQLESKKVGNNETTPLQVVNYNYNIRGWLTGINDIVNINKLFNFSIGYNTGQNPLYNGNISQTQWRTANTDSSLKSYTYSYDALNRITAASGANSFSNYDVSNISYDKMGNIQSLTRNGWQDGAPYVNMDVLTYDYGIENANRLFKVDDAGNKAHGFKEGVTTGNDYRYDTNGNMVMDKNKGIGSSTVDGITYNHLNLPTQVTIANTEHNGNIQYIYDATGVKQRKIVSDGTTQSYAGNYIYKNNVLEFFNHAEGYVNNDNGTYEYVYQYKDHLGNVRLSYQDADNNGVIDAATEIIDEKNYYPFGLSHKGYNFVNSSLGNSVAGKFGFGGKELGEELGLDWYDVTARNYDPAIGRWSVIDPKADDIMQIDITPYNYSWNTPTNINDPDGECPWCWGAVIGAVVEMGTQVATNMIVGDQSFGEAFMNINYEKVGIATVTGALTGGLSSIKVAGSVAKVYKGMAVSSTAAGGNIFTQNYEGNKTIDATKLAIDLISENIPVPRTPKIPDVSENIIKAAEKKLDRATRVAGDKPRLSRAEAVKKSKEEVKKLKKEQKTIDKTNEVNEAIKAAALSSLEKATREYNKNLQAKKRQ